MTRDQISARIFLRRTEVGLTQKQLGERLGVSECSVWRWENGDRIPTVPMLHRLGVELDTTFVLGKS
jgi:transcriptional regulator with XRE-family HTH domain